MASVAGYFLFTIAITYISLICNATTHWVVTEDGRIQSQPETYFNMKRPYDLVAMLKQEERLDTMKQIQHELSSKTDTIKHQEERTVGLEHTFYKTDPDCIAAGKPLAEFDLYISTLLPIENKGIRISDYVDLQSASQITEHSEPDCIGAVNLDFSIHAFEHLEGMKDRAALSGSAEMGLKNAVAPTIAIEDYGSLVAEAMKSNKTSWVLYNMAAFYWRIKGNSHQVVECVRRALHYSPQEQKDVALINLGNVLHRAHLSNEAAIVVHAAVAVSSNLNVNHFTLANIYAVLGEYNKSLICFENTLRIQPDFEVAEKRRLAILCHYKLESALEVEHQRLQKTLGDLREYQAKHDTYRRHNERVLQEQVGPDERLLQRVAFEQYTIQRRENGRYNSGAPCKRSERGGEPGQSCDSSVNHRAHLTRLFQQYQEEEIPRASSEKMDEYDKPKHPKIYPKQLPLLDAIQEESKDWPSKEDCDSAHNIPKPSLLPSVYLPPHNKGFDVSTLLTIAQGLNVGDQHNLPWYPPVCDPIAITKDNEAQLYVHLRSLRPEEMIKITAKIPDSSLKPELTKLVDENKVTEEEIGQRILTALKQTKGRGRWLLYNVAGLYWMLRGHSVHGVECLRHAVHLTPQAYRDVSLLNLASVMYRIGHYADAGVLVADALKIDDHEPSSHTLMGSVLWAKGNNSGATWHYKQALRNEPEYTAAKKMLLLLRCNSKFPSSQSSAKKSDSVASGCAPKGDKPGGSSDRKYVCKMDDGEEKCVMEGPSAEKDKNNCNCNTFCTRSTDADQSGDESDKDDLDASHLLHGCPFKASNSCPGLDDSFFSTEIAGTIDEVTEFYEKRGFCRGEECKRMQIAQPSGQRSHIKLCMLDGHLHQKIILANSPNDIHVENHECLIYSDGSCSVGCNRDEYRHYVTMMEEKAREGMVMIDDMARSKVTVKEETLDTGETLVRVTRETVELAMVGDDMLREMTLPDTSVHLRGLSEPELPTLEECKTTKTVNFLHFTSTWLAVSAKGIDLREHVDFDSDIEKTLREPFCVAPAVFDGDITEYPGLIYPDALAYRAELGLTKVMRYTSGHLRPVAITAMSIAVALEKNPTSWVLASIASLYWRMEGNAREAVECIKVGLHNAPADKKDVALVNLANILFKSGQYDDAIVVMDKALHASHEPVVSHFIMANLYTAKLEWDKAIMFYHSTLQRQASFRPAKQRLTLIQCIKKLKFGG